MQRLQDLLDRLKLMNPNVEEHDGLTAGEIRAVFSKLGLPLPKEVEELYQWRNGIDELNAFTHMERLSRAVDTYEIYLELESDSYVDSDEDDKWGWKPTWFPIVDTNGDFQICVDLETLGLALVDMECDLAIPVCDHYSTYLDASTEGFDDGAFSWNEEHGYVEADEGKWGKVLKRYQLPAVTMR